MWLERLKNNGKKVYIASKFHDNTSQRDHDSYGQV